MSDNDAHVDPLFFAKLVALYVRDLKTPAGASLPRDVQVFVGAMYLGTSQEGKGWKKGWRARDAFFEALDGQVPPWSTTAARAEAKAAKKAAKAAQVEAS